MEGISKETQPVRAQTVFWVTISLLWIGPQRIEMERIFQINVLSARYVSSLFFILIFFHTPYPCLLIIPSPSVFQSGGERSKRQYSDQSHGLVFHFTAIHFTRNSCLNGVFPQVHKRSQKQAPAPASHLPKSIFPVTSCPNWRCVEYGDSIPSF